MDHISCVVGDRRRSSPHGRAIATSASPREPEPSADEEQDGAENFLAGIMQSQRLNWSYAS